jgi:hypothetical protein
VPKKRGKKEEGERERERKREREREREKRGPVLKVLIWKARMETARLGQSLFGEDTIKCDFPRTEKPNWLSPATAS